MPRFKTQD